MICRLCLNNSEKKFNLFEGEGIEKEVAVLIGKYLWFEPKPDDGFSHSICLKCWESIDTFNSFYVQIEEAHKIFLDKCMEIKADPSEIDKIVFRNSYEIEEKSENDDTNEKYRSCSQNFDNVLKEEVIFEAVGDTTSFNTNRIHQKSRFSIKNKKKELSELGEMSNIDCHLDEKKNQDFKKFRNCKTNCKPKLQEMDKQKRNRKTPEEVAALNKKLTDEDKIIASFMKVYCNVCSLEQKNFSSFKKHCTLEHKQKGFVICCDKKYFKRFLLVDHIEKHLNPESYKCSFCEKNFTSRWTLRDHIQFIHKNVENNIFFKCSHCKKSFTNKNLMLRHELFHIPENEREFKCNSCDKAFPSKATLDCHVRIEHEKRYAGICDICGKSYKNKADLKRHRWEQHEGDDKPKIQCKFCDLQFLSRYTYQLHKNNDHKNQNVEQKCSTCEKTFPNTEALKSHIRYTHNTKPKFQCNICDKYFKRQLVLKEHMAVHTGQQLYACPHCPKTFTHSSNMHHHRKRVHPKEFEEARQLHNMEKESWCKKTALKN